MGKSYRRPYAAVTGVRSAAHDKMVARRCWRRAQEQAIRDCRDWEELVIPRRLEASFNDVWSWGRDGKQTLQHPPTLKKFWSWRFCTAEEDYERQLHWYQKLQRK
jgi:hypothetical protein